ncbi:12068_t:CDS:2 [Ambispora leptoticha]|uniref:Chitobiosyldiphosphodolichol beta-mannosyltransferase n=1 Tax=Ambispora leptoticha TaxID=144679 RepID=A0A9N8ZAB0_9GLOM|nr:12068_t:CDS:2 [Ambispora leptoticha]
MEVVEDMEELEMENLTSGTIIPFSEVTILTALVFALVVIRGTSLLYFKYVQNAAIQKKKNVTLVVLGDIGRSPRMQYHALSFSRNGWHVDFVGYDGSTPMTAITDNKNIKIHHISHPWRLPEFFPKILFLLYAPIKVYAQMLTLYWTLLWRINSPDFVLVQNPPSIPTLLIVQFVVWLRQTNLIVDWHNFGYTILALRLGEDNSVVKFAKWHEKVWGRRAVAHLTVTAAMHRELLYKWEVDGKVATLYDRPPQHFRRLELDEIHEFFSRINLEDIITLQSTGSSTFLTDSSSDSSTLFTHKPSPQEPARFRSDRPILIVSSTSWTADEDFSILLRAAQKFDEVAKSGGAKTFPKLLFVITGNGPLKEKYMQDISRLPLQHVRIVTMWLTAEDYPLLLGSADLGISLHKSSSGMDLPMKVVDMFGCGLPVCAVNFQCLDELVRHNKNGLIFNDAEELAKQLIDLFADYPVNASKLDSMREHIKDFQKERWDSNWDRVVLPILSEED